MSTFYMTSQGHQTWVEVRDDADLATLSRELMHGMAHADSDGYYHEQVEFWRNGERDLRLR